MHTPSSLLLLIALATSASTCRALQFTFFPHKLCSNWKLNLQIAVLGPISSRHFFILSTDYNGFLVDGTAFTAGAVTSPKLAMFGAIPLHLRQDSRFRGVVKGALSFDHQDIEYLAFLLATDSAYNSLALVPLDGHSNGTVRRLDGTIFNFGADLMLLPANSKEQFYTNEGGKMTQWTVDAGRIEQSTGEISNKHIRPSTPELQLQLPDQLPTMDAGFVSDQIVVTVSNALQKVFLFKSNFAKHTAKLLAEVSYEHFLRCFERSEPNLSTTSEPSRSTSRIVITVIGLIAIAALVSICIFCMLTKRKAKSQQKSKDKSTCDHFLTGEDTKRVE